ncbi:MAG: hypothetical protein KAU38_16655 [Desulfobacterales bacterium]|nr:hypothetical protein [Desulfobacterales bacterium]
MDSSDLEAYPERNRCLFYADVAIEGIKMPLHVVCEQTHSEDAVDFVTAYIPSDEEWETPTRRRKNR